LRVAREGWNGVATGVLPCVVDGPLDPEELLWVGVPSDALDGAVTVDDGDVVADVFV
jgi:hypothetical protein